MSDRAMWQKLIHNQRQAIVAANASAGCTLYTPGMSGLISLVMLSEASGPPTTNQLLLHWVRFKHAADNQCAYRVLYRLRDNGLIRVERQKNCNRIHLTVQGQLWLKVFEKGLKKRIKLG